MIPRKILHSGTEYLYCRRLPQESFSSSSSNNILLANFEVVAYLRRLEPHPGLSLHLLYCSVQSREVPRSSTILVKNMDGRQAAQPHRVQYSIWRNPNPRIVEKLRTQGFRNASQVPFFYGDRLTQYYCLAPRGFVSLANSGVIDHSRASHGRGNFTPC